MSVTLSVGGTGDPEGAQLRVGPSDSADPADVRGHGIASGCRYARNLRPGDRYYANAGCLGTHSDGQFLITEFREVEVLSGPTDAEDFFGRTLMKYWLREVATGREGSAMFGHFGVVRVAITEPEYQVVTK